MHGHVFMEPTKSEILKDASRFSKWSYWSMIKTMHRIEAVTEFLSAGGTGGLHVHKAGSFGPVTNTGGHLAYAHPQEGEEEKGSKERLQIY